MGLISIFFLIFGLLKSKKRLFSANLAFWNFNENEQGSWNFCSLYLKIGMCHPWVVLKKRYLWFFIILIFYPFSGLKRTKNGCFWSFFNIFSISAGRKQQNKSKSEKITSNVFDTYLEDASKKNRAISINISISLSFPPKFNLKFDRAFNI